LDPEEVELKSHIDSKNNESARKENFDPIGQNINDDMHSTFLHNNEQIIADLANLEIEQEKQIFQIVFDTFINDHGLTDLENLTILGKALGHEENAVEDMCKQVNENFDGMMDFEQFWELLPKMDSVFTPKDIHKQDQENSKSQRPEEEKKLDEIIEKKQDETNDMDKNQDLAKDEYDEELDKVNQREPKLADYKDNAIVPSNGVALTPDSRIVKLIKQLNNYFRNCEKNKQFGEAKVVKYKLERLKKKELKRQKDYLRANQEKELISIENSQKMQFYEFSQAWDTFMSDYEATAYLSLEKLKERHSKEMSELQREYRESIESKIKFSKKVYDLKRRIEALINMRQYEEADKYKTFLTKLEAEEREERIKELK